MFKYTFFLSYRTELFKRYEGLFRQDEIGDDDEEVRTGRLTIEDVMAMNGEKRSKKWSWISMIYSLCNGDITKTNEIVSKPFTECLIWMSYEKEMNIKK